MGQALNELEPVNEKDALKTLETLNELDSLKPDEELNVELGMNVHVDEKVCDALNALE